MIVVDASAWVRALIDSGERGATARDALHADPEWLAPAHCPLEVLRTLRRYELSKHLSAVQADRHSEAVRNATVRYYESEPWLLAQVWQLLRNVSVYDAPYLAIAHTHDVPIVTSDQRLASAAASLQVATIVT